MKKIMFRISIPITGLALFVAFGAQLFAQKPFPAIMPLEKGNKLSAATERLYDDWNIYGDRANELFTNFLYSRIDGLSDDVSRRDPTKVIKVDDTYYVYYTHRKTAMPPQGRKYTDEIPSTDWDLADIFYATSKDGFTWEEKGVAVARPPKGEYGWRSLSTPGVLIWKGKYYIYFQAFNEAPAAISDRADVRIAWSDSPDGPFEIVKNEIISFGKEGEWDAKVIHDPCPIVYKGKIYVYYKSQNFSLRDKRDVVLEIGAGVAIADDPLGPYKKSPLNPVLNSGHEACMFPFKGGVAAFVSLNGPEKNTIQWSPDGLNFQIASHVIMAPIAPAPYVPDAFTDTKDGRGVAWGLCHVSKTDKPGEKENMLIRFDCDLSQDINDEVFKFKKFLYGIRFGKSVYLDGSLALPEFVKKKKLSGEK
ncbi:MAG: glycoside hydrolase [Calditrichaeota bacterium]|nr:MAG: glycoside hydrolase [Calditrichota bacterium]